MELTDWSKHVEDCRIDIIDAFRDWQEFGHFKWCPIMDPDYYYIDVPECDCSVSDVEDMLDDYTAAVMQDARDMYLD